MNNPPAPPDGPEMPPEFEEAITKLVALAIADGILAAKDDKDAGDEEYERHIISKRREAETELRTSLSASLGREQALTTVCICADWMPGMEKINGPIVLQQLRRGESLSADHFIPFRFCPWCGSKVRP